MKNLIIILATVSLTSQAFANAALGIATGVAASKSSGSSTNTSGGSTLQQSSQNTMNNSQKGQSTAQAVTGGLMMVGAQFAGQCASMIWAACPIAAGLLMLGMQSKKSADSFQPAIDSAWNNVCTFSSTGCSGSTPPNPYTAALTPSVINPGKVNNDAAAIETAIRNAGYSVDPNSGIVKTPKGSFTADPASMASAMGADGFNKLMDAVKKAEADALNKVNGVDQKFVNKEMGFDGGGGMGAVAAVSGYDEGGGAGAAGGGSFAGKLGKVRNPAQIQGLSKNFNGEPIGVAADSIFEMMSRRYQLKTTQKTFFDKE